MTGQMTGNRRFVNPVDPDMLSRPQEASDGHKHTYGVARPADSRKDGGKQDSQKPALCLLMGAYVPLQVQEPGGAYKCITSKSVQR